MKAVVLPGLDGTGRMLAKFVEHLGQRCATSVIAYPDNHALSYPQLADFILARLPVREPFVLIANRSRVRWRRSWRRADQRA